MGCDGGSIPKRKEIVKRKSKQAKPDREVELIHKWGYCTVSDQALRRPIVSTPIGDLMNKEGAIEHLLDYKNNQSRACDLREESLGLNTFNSLKDLKELNLTDAPKDTERSNTAGSSTSTKRDEEIKWANFVCPITNLEMNGRYKFVFSWNCGCVVSERALKEVPNDSKCLVCQKPYEEYDVVILQPDDAKDIERNQAALLARTTARLVKRNLRKESR